MLVLKRSTAEFYWGLSMRIAIALVIAIVVTLAIVFNLVEVGTPKRVTVSTYTASTVSTARVTTSVVPISTTTSATSSSYSTSTKRFELQLKPRNLTKVLSYIVELRRELGYGYGYAVAHASIPPFVKGLEAPSTLTVVYNTSSQNQKLRVSGTNVQVEGIDELDLVKTDGRYIYVGVDDKVYIVNASSKEPRVIAAIDVDAVIRGLFVYRDRIAIVTTRGFNGIAATHIYVYTFRDGSPKLLKTIDIDGYVIDGRLSGRYMYLVLTRPIMSVDDIVRINGKAVDAKDVVVLGIDPSSSYVAILAIDLKNLDFSYKVFVAPAATRIYLSRTGNLYIVSPLSKVYELLDIFRNSLDKLPKDLASKLKLFIEKNNVLNAVRVLRMYLSRIDVRTFERVVEVLRGASSDVYTKSVIYLFRVKGLNIVFLAKRVIDGIVRDQFAIEEKNGFLFIATTVQRVSIVVYPIVHPVVPEQRDVVRGPITIIVRTSNTTKTLTIPYIITIRKLVYVWVYPSSTLWNNFYVLKVPNLTIVAKLEKLAEGERVYAARLVGNLFLLVTYRRVDPVFAIDVSDPKNPRVLGFLEMPGYSGYLHPLGKGFVVGIGLSDNPWGLKICLINISNPMRMVETSKIIMKNIYSPVLSDHHAFLVDPNYNYFVIPIRSYTFSGIAVVKYDLDRGVLEKPIVIRHRDAFRAIYIDEKLYSISPTSILVIDIETFKILTKVKLEENR